jgi:hypothetical protein
VPPKGLFAKRDWQRLIELPACDRCNNDPSDDEEYLIWAITTNAMSVGEAADAARARRLEDPSNLRRMRMVERLLKSARRVEVHTPTGIYLGPAYAYDPQAERCNRALVKIVRGLYFHETGTRVSDDHDAVAWIYPEGDWARYQHTIHAIQRTPLRVIVEDGFEYWFAQPVDNPTASVVLMRFFRGFVGLGCVAQRTKLASLRTRAQVSKP